MSGGKKFTYRVERIPPLTTRAELIQKYFYKEDQPYLTVKSLEASVRSKEGHVRDKVATILFAPPDPRPSGPRIQDDTISVGRDFIGFTPLYVPQEGQIAADVIAVTGLAGHAFGSWAYSESIMWLRDYLPEDAPEARILTYGYRSNPKGSNVSVLQDHTNTFVQRLIAMRDLGGCESRPIIFIGHSLGCLIIKMAIHDFALRAPKNRLPVRKIIFLGAPHMGLNITALQSLVKEKPTARMIQELEAGSYTLTSLNNSFQHLAHDIDVLTLYETELTKTVIDVDGEWKREGPAVMMVSPDSAIQFRGAKESPIAVPCNHSQLAKITDGESGIYPSIVRTVRDGLASTARIAAGFDPNRVPPNFEEGFQRSMSLRDEPTPDATFPRGYGSPYESVQSPECSNDGRETPWSGPGSSGRSTPSSNAASRAEIHGSFYSPLGRETAPVNARSRPERGPSFGNPAYSSSNAGYFPSEAQPKLSVLAHDRFNPAASTTSFQDVAVESRPPPPPGPPPGLEPEIPEGWRAEWNDTYNASYYVNIYTQETQWGKPTEKAIHPYPTTTSSAPVAVHVSQAKKTLSPKRLDCCRCERSLLDQEFHFSCSTCRKDALDNGRICSDCHDKLEVCDEHDIFMEKMAVRARFGFRHFVYYSDARVQPSDNPLVRAIKERNLTPLNDMVRNAALLQTSLRDSTWPPLHIASQLGYFDCVRVLAESEILRNSRDKFNRTALYVAVHYGEVGVVEALLDCGANIGSMGDTNDNTALHRAAITGQVDILKVLLSRGAPLDVKNKKGQTPIYLAAQSGDADSIRALLQAGANPSVVADDAHTPLRVASRRGHLDAVKTLVELGVKIDDIDPIDGWTALMEAAHAGNHEICALLLRNGANINRKSQNGGLTPLHYAGMKGDEATINVIMDNDPEPDLEITVEEGGLNILQWACKYGYTELCTELLEAKVDLRAKGSFESFCSLRLAINNSQAAIVDLLLACPEVDADSYLDEEFSGEPLSVFPLYQAALKGETEICRMLLDAGAYIDAETEVAGCNAVEGAAYGGHLETVKLLLERGASGEPPSGLNGKWKNQVFAPGVTESAKQVILTMLRRAKHS